MDLLKALTLNVWNKSGPYSARLALIKKELVALAPDVVGLQEVLRLETATPSSATDQALELTSGMGYQIAYAFGSHLGGGLFLGNALATPHRIVEEEAVVLPGTETGEKRSLLYALLETPQGLWPVFVTHLNYKPEHGHVRLEQAQAIADFVERVEGHATESWLPAVLMGDLNAEPESDEIRFLKGLHSVGSRSVFFNDVWRYAEPSPGFTFDRRNPFAAQWREPPRRIDYVFVRGPDRWGRGEPQEVRLAFADAEAGTFPSDHFGIYAEFAMARRGAPQA
jgi:endonuclease/exonuclease/phosphatase family metal-dependent hydrolase